jgi:hypothetical protein
LAASWSMVRFIGNAGVAHSTSSYLLYQQLCGSQSQGVRSAYHASLLSHVEVRLVSEAVKYLQL